MSLGSLCSVVKALIVSGVRQTKQGTRSPIELLWTAKNYLGITGNKIIEDGEDHDDEGNGA